MKIITVFEARHRVIMAKNTKALVSKYRGGTFMKVTH